MFEPLDKMEIAGEKFVDIFIPCLWRVKNELCLWKSPRKRGK